MAVDNISSNETSVNKLSNGTSDNILSDKMVEMGNNKCS